MCDSRRPAEGADSVPRGNRPANPDAEWLRNYLEDFGMAYTGPLERIDAALRAERLAVVEEIRARMGNRPAEQVRNHLAVLRGRAERQWMDGPALYDVREIDAASTALDAALPAERLAVVERMLPYLQHEPDCASRTPEGDCVCGLASAFDEVGVAGLTEEKGADAAYLREAAVREARDAAWPQLRDRPSPEGAEPRTEALDRMAATLTESAERIRDHTENGWSWKCVSIEDAIVAMADLREAAPPEPPLDVDVLANIIRQEDGNHSLGAGALAERIVARLRGTGGSSHG